jgi:glycerol-3-phosphate acyltransferase PlsY
MEILFVAVTAYIFGSFPTALIAGKLLKKIDIRDHGSGNAGATNVLRILGWKAALVVLLIDMFKGFVPVFWLTEWICGPGENLIFYQILAAIMAIVGHIWTIFAGFRGGKGVGTAAGVFLGLAPLALSLSLLAFIIVVSFTKYVSLGSLIGSLTLAVTLTIQKFVLHHYIPDVLLYVGIVIVILIWIAHRENIKRLLSGSENKVSFSSKK